MVSSGEMAPALCDVGLLIRAQVLGRAIGLLYGHAFALNPFFSTET